MTQGVKSSPSLSDESWKSLGKNGPGVSQSIPYKGALEVARSEPAASGGITGLWLLRISTEVLDLTSYSSSARGYRGKESFPSSLLTIPLSPTGQLFLHGAGCPSPP